MLSRSAEQKKPLRYVYIAIMGILILAIVLAAIVWSQVIDAARVRAALIRAYDTKAISLQLLSDLSYAETAQRGYVLTGDDDFLKPYASLRSTLLREINILIGLRFDDPKTQKLAASLAELTHERLEELSVVIQVRNGQGLEAAANRVAAGRGQEIMEEVRGLSSNLLGQQEATIAALASSQREHVYRIRIIIALLLLGIVLLAVSTAWLIAVFLRQRDQAERQLRAGMTRQLALFEGAMDAIVIANAQGNIESINPAAQRMFRMKPDDLTSLHFAALISETCQHRQLALEDIRSLADGGGHTIEISAVRQDGEIIPAELALSAVEQSDDFFYIAAFRDVTDRKRAEQAKREFISTVSHELRTPLTSISGALKLFLHTRGKELTPEALRLLDIADRNTQRLTKLVNDILDIDKLEAGKMVFNDVDAVLEDIVDAAVEAISPFARNNDVVVEFISETAHTPLRIDPLRLSQALTNLLSNAIKFSPVGSTVQVRTTRQDTQVRIAVIDQGPGIPDDFIPRVFSKFSQASTPSLMYKGGTGLGLSIVKEIVERMGGQVTFETSTSGTIFYICLPLSSDALGSNAQA